MSKSAEIPTRMKALRKTRPARGAELETVQVPEIGPQEVLVEVTAASICGTDLHIYSWDRWAASRIRPPLTFGHEFCGRIARVGAEVEGLAEGEFVSAEMHVNCGYCHQCRVGQPHICQNLKIIGIDQDGCFAQYVRIPARNIWKIDPAIPERYAAILDPLGNAVHTVLSGEIVGQTVAVTGCGPIGLMAIAVAKACGSGPVFATEINPHRLAMARRMGADLALNPAEADPVGAVLEATKGVGVDVLLEMSGSPRAIEQGLAMLRAGGRAALLGVPTEKVTLDLVRDIIFKGVTLLGIYGRRMFQTWVQMTELLKTGRLHLDPLFSAEMALEEFSTAFELLQAGKADKIIVFPNGKPK